MYDLPPDPEEHDDGHPDSSGSWLDRLFWVGYMFLPSWLLPDSRLAHYVVDRLWVDCAWCMFMRGWTLGAMAGFIAGVIVGVIL